MPPRRTLTYEAQTPRNPQIRGLPTAVYDTQSIGGLGDLLSAPGKKLPAKDAAMELNRNQFFLAGLVLLFLGIQFRLMDSFTLNEKTTRFLASRMQDKSAVPTVALVGEGGSLGRKVVQPPQWLGYALLSIGSVLVLHSLAMPKPGGGG
jgi:hypothetical protein